MIRREPAWRIFAGEYNDSQLEIKGSGEKHPSYVVSPLGAKINRVYVVGVLTDVENISEGGELMRAHLSDPSGVFTLYSGQYQPEATASLSTIDVPAFVAVIGKAKTYVPEEGELYVSLRPELVREVHAGVRDRWILETSMHTKERITALSEAKKMNPVNAYDLRKLGYSKELSEGVVAALKHYGTVDLHKYVSIIQESLQYLHPSRETQQPVRQKAKQAEERQTQQESKKKTTAKDKKQKKEKPVVETQTDSEDIEKHILKIIKQLEGNQGAAWDEIMKKCTKEGYEEDQIEEALTSLMDKGLIYEPILGTIKTT